jgi:hypothetical protein
MEILTGKADLGGDMFDASMRPGVRPLILRAVLYRATVTEWHLSG